MKSWAMALCTLCFAGFGAFGASFEGYTNFQAVPVWGDVDVTCWANHGGNQFRHYLCQDEILEPFEFGYFTAEGGNTATEARLVSHRADGKMVKKSVGYDSTKGQSKNEINLWIETLFQTSLLDIGVNTIDYKLVDAQGETQAQGQLTATVDRSQRRMCPPGHEFGNRESDCQFPDRICRIYFERRNWCR